MFHSLSTKDVDVSQRIALFSKVDKEKRDTQTRPISSDEEATNGKEAIEVTGGSDSLQEILQDERNTEAIAGNHQQTGQGRNITDERYDSLMSIVEHPENIDAVGKTFYKKHLQDDMSLWEIKEENCNTKEMKDEEEDKRQKKEDLPETAVKQVKDPNKEMKDKHETTSEREHFEESNLAVANETITSLREEIKLLKEKEIKKATEFESQLVQERDKYKELQRKYKEKEEELKEMTTELKNLLEKFQKYAK